MNPALQQAIRFADAVKALAPYASVPVLSRGACIAEGYSNAEAAVSLADTPFDAVDDLRVNCISGEQQFRLDTEPIPGIRAEAFTPTLLLFYFD